MCSLSCLHNSLLIFYNYAILFIIHNTIPIHSLTVSYFVCTCLSHYLIITYTFSMLRLLHCACFLKIAVRLQTNFKNEIPSHRSINMKIPNTNNEEHEHQRSHTRKQDQGRTSKTPPYQIPIVTIKTRKPQF